MTVVLVTQSRRNAVVAVLLVLLVATTNVFDKIVGGVVVATATATDNQDTITNHQTDVASASSSSTTTTTTTTTASSSSTIVNDVLEEAFGTMNDGVEEFQSYFAPNAEFQFCHQGGKLGCLKGNFEQTISILFYHNTNNNNNQNTNNIMPQKIQMKFRNVISGNSNDQSAMGEYTTYYEFFGGSCKALYSGYFYVELMTSTATTSTKKHLINKFYSYSNETEESFRCFMDTIVKQLQLAKEQTTNAAATAAGASSPLNPNQKNKNKEEL